MSADESAPGGAEEAPSGAPSLAPASTRPAAAASPASPEHRVEVAVLLPVDQSFSYAVPEAWGSVALQAGQRVLAPFGRRTVTAVVLDRPPSAAPGVAVKELAELLDPTPLLPTAILRLAEFCADHYLYPLGEVLRAAMPPGLAMRGSQWLERTQQSADGLRTLQGSSHELLQALLDAPSGRLRLGGRSGRSIKEARALLEGDFARLVHALEGVRSAVGRAPASERRYQLALPMAEAKALLTRAPAQRALLEWVGARGMVNRAELLAAVPRAEGALRRLVSRGLLQEAQDCQEGETPASGTRSGGVQNPILLNEEQAPIVAAAVSALSGGFSTHLIDGVTGSGKTEIYLRVIAAALEAGQGALVLVPEISLTPQLVGRFRDRFGAAVALLHSGRSDAERRRAWGRLQRGEATIAVGVRSAVFAPVSKLGVIVVDEEHDGSFKQEEGLCYHARDLALVRGQQACVPVLLGSATPSLESLANVARGRFVHHRLFRRVEDRPMPRLELIDLRVHGQELSGEEPSDARSGDKGDSAQAIQVRPLLSPPLLASLRATVSGGRQAILFLNRRGQRPALVCEACGRPQHCPNCEVSLTQHRSPAHLLCHYCGFESPVRSECGHCGGALFSAGAGTQALEDEVNLRVPGARVLRLDRDATAKRGAMAERLASFARRDFDVMVGTQMVAKGHDFPGVTLVGVVLADQGLWLPDLRAGERCVQVLSQVAGRAGRGADPGRVLLQTWQPSHPALVAVASGHYAAFAQQELASRAQGRWPPMSKLLLLRFSGTHSVRVERAACDHARAAEAAAERNPEAGVELLGPAAAPLQRLRGKTRWQLLLRAPTTSALHWMGRYLRGLKLPAGVVLQLDMDPVSML